MKKSSVVILLLSTLYSCENRDINAEEEFRPREVHDSFKNVPFSKVTVDGVEYLMLERDNNNPHEGFGFMAFRANSLIETQDTIMAYLKTLNDMQSRIYAKTYSTSLEDSDSVGQTLFNYYLTLEQEKLNKLSQESLKDTTATE